MANTIEKWLKSVNDQYQLDVVVDLDDKQFVNWKVEISDPRNLGLSMTLYADKAGDFSLFTTGVFDFPRFNIAEGYTSEDMRSAAEAILEGHLNIRKGIITNKKKLCFNTSRGKICSRATAKGKSNYEPYSRKK